MPGSTVKWGALFTLLPSWRRCLSPCWAAWAWGTGDEYNMELVFLHSSLSFLVCPLLRCYNPSSGILSFCEGILSMDGCSN